MCGEQEISMLKAYHCCGMAPQIHLTQFALWTTMSLVMLMLH